MSKISWDCIKLPNHAAFAHRVMSSANVVPTSQLRYSLLADIVYFGPLRIVVSLTVCILPSASRF